MSCSSDDHPIISFEFCVFPIRICPIAKQLFPPKIYFWTSFSKTIGKIFCLGAQAVGFWNPGPRPAGRNSWNSFIWGRCCHYIWRPQTDFESSHSDISCKFHHFQFSNQPKQQFLIFEFSPLVRYYLTFETRPVSKMKIWFSALFLWHQSCNKFFLSISWHFRFHIDFLFLCPFSLFLYNQ